MGVNLRLKINIGSNRTFMELKWGKDFQRVERKSRSNRTFMELKFAIVCGLLFSIKVLIVPLWN